LARKKLGGLSAIITRLEDLPRIGSSWNFVGRDHGNVPVSFYVVEMQPGQGAPLHCHTYDEIILVQSGRSRVVIGDEVHQAIAGSVVVVKAGTPHGFINTGPELLIQIDIHSSEVLAQTNLPPTAASRQAGLPE
jgi:quercetin dioxygenase-like cupin family protein